MRNEEKYLTRLTDYELGWIMDQIKEQLAAGYRGIDETIRMVNFYQKLQKDKEYYDKLEEEICI